MQLRWKWTAILCIANFRTPYFFASPRIYRANFPRLLAHTITCSQNVRTAFVDDLGLPDKEGHKRYVTPELSYSSFRFAFVNCEGIFFKLCVVASLSTHQNISPVSRRRFCLRDIRLRGRQMLFH